MSVLQYTLKPSLKRVIWPHFIKVLFIYALFFIAIILNLRLLNFSISYLYYGIIILFVIILLVADIILTSAKTKKIVYEFYLDSIKLIEKKETVIPIAEIQSVDVKRNIFDKIFRTATIVIQHEFKIKHIDDYDQIVSYVNQLRDYSHQTPPINR